MDQSLRIAELERRLSGSFQLLQALLGIRLRAVQDPESRRHLVWLSDVTAALGLLNRRMMTGDPTDFAGYLKDTAAFWRRACAERPIRIEVRASSTPLPESHAASLALIVHELVVNAVRHAFPGDAQGAIAIAYSPASTGVSIVVRDSGIGCDPLVKGEGLALVEGLVAHLGGVMSIETAPGAGLGVRIRLPLQAPTH